MRPEAWAQQAAPLPQDIRNGAGGCGENCCGRALEKAEAKTNGEDARLQSRRPLQSSRQRQPSRRDAGATDSRTTAERGERYWVAPSGRML